MPDRLAPDAVRALIADAGNHATLAEVYGQDLMPKMLRRLAAALEASLPREDADLDAILKRHEAREFVPMSYGSDDYPEGESGTICAECGWMIRSTVPGYSHPDSEEQHRQHVLWLASRTVETAEETGASLIAAERARQLTEEGYSVEHDRGHSTELILAGMSYAERTATGPTTDESGKEVPEWDWPWHADYWKPTGDPVRDLTKAGALIAAAIDSLRLPPAPPASEKADHA